MECIQLDTTSTFMNEAKKKEETSDSFFIRFCRKKYKCVFLWLLSIIAVSQLFIIIFDKIDSNILTKVISNFFIVDKNNTNSPKTEENNG